MQGSEKANGWEGGELMGRDEWGEVGRVTLVI